jgi:hypothetical protein
VHLWPWLTIFWLGIPRRRHRASPGPRSLPGCACYLSRARTSHSRADAGRRPPLRLMMRSGRCERRRRRGRRGGGYRQMCWIGLMRWSSSASLGAVLAGGGVVAVEQRALSEGSRCGRGHLSSSRSCKLADKRQQGKRVSANPLCGERTGCIDRRGRSQRRRPSLCRCCWSMDKRPVFRKEVCRSFRQTLLELAAAAEVTSSIRPA